MWASSRSGRLGLFFAVAYCVAYGRTGNVRPRRLSLLVGLVRFLAMFGTPFVKSPSNPPSIGDPDAIRDRGALWVLIIVVSIIVLVVAVVLGQRFRLGWAPGTPHWSRAPPQSRCSGS